MLPPVSLLNPILLGCPRCKAGKGARCQTPAGRYAKQLHRERFMAFHTHNSEVANAGKVTPLPVPEELVMVPVPKSRLIEVYRLLGEEQ